MKVIEFGDINSEKTITIVGGIHGDEPSTVDCLIDIKRLIEENKLNIEKHHLKLVIANEKAYDKGERYIERDLNRVFPGEEESDIYEVSLAARLVEEIQNDDFIIGLHTTHSAPPPFAIAHYINRKEIRNLLKILPINYTIDSSKLRDKNNEGYSIDVQFKNCIEVEIGEQKSKQAQLFGVKVIKTILNFFEMIDTITTKETTVEVVTVKNELKKVQGEPQFYYNNFNQVPEGEVIAEDGGISHISVNGYDTPALVSEEGYENIFGLVGEKTGEIK